MSAISLFVVILHMAFWRKIEGMDGANSSASTTPPSTLSSVESFLRGSLSRNCSPELISIDDYQWEIQIHKLLEHLAYLEKQGLIDLQDYSCNGSCGLERRYDLLAQPDCFCDELCDVFGDCCFDYEAQCRANQNNTTTLQDSNEACFRFSGYKSYALWNTCPKNWDEESARQKCEDEGQADSVLNNLPVFDKDSQVTYRNIFCAKCNGAVNTSYWKLTFGCEEGFDFSSSDFKSSDLSLLSIWCKVRDKRPGDFQLKQLKSCIPRPKESCAFSLAKSETYCQAKCLSYALPVTTKFRNPHCALCNGFTLTDILWTDKVHLIPPPPMTILFDFSSTSKFSVNVLDDQKGVVQRFEKTESCSSDEVYDPYVNICKTITSVSSPPTQGHNSSSNGKGNGTEEWNINCTVVAYNKTDYEVLPNGEIFLKAHGKRYSNTTYRIHDNRLFLCVNFSKNYTKTENEPGGINNTRTTPKSLQLLTLIGSVVSVVSLVLLLVTYILFSELRNLPGKVVINLAISLLLYQSVFFSAAKKNDQETCLAIAVLLHFFVLSSFTWMNVMAFDVRRTFTNVSGVAANRRGGSKKRLLCYCLYAWGVPGVVVSTCVTVDRVDKGSIGYGQGEEECFISEPQAKLYSFVLPVAVILIFNLFALGHTCFYIFSTRRRTRRVTNQQQSTSVALICVKMASVMGVTWILGIAANLKALSILWYPYVVLNSLQGFFIFLSFAASGKALELYRKRLASVLEKRATQNNTQRSGNSNLICPPDENHATLETEM